MVEKGLRERCYKQMPYFGGDKQEKAEGLGRKGRNKRREKIRGAEERAEGKGRQIRGAREGESRSFGNLIIRGRKCRISNILPWKLKLPWQERRNLVSNWTKSSLSKKLIRIVSRLK